MKKNALMIGLMLLLALSLFAQPNTKWAGSWVKSKNYSFVIKDVTATTFYYNFSCFNGKNFGEAEGVANINGNEAISNPEDSETCKIKFILKDDHIEVQDLRIDDCIIDSGYGVYYEGKYKAKKGKKK